MAIRISITRGEKNLAKILLELAKGLINVLGDNLLVVESYDGSDGSNVKIVVRKKDWATIEKIFSVIKDIETELNILGEILPEIFSYDEQRIFRDVPTRKLTSDIINKLNEQISKYLGNNLVAVESYDGSDGSNVKIVVRKKDWATIEKIFSVIKDIETELNIPGEILPEIERIGEL
ncbi:MAG: hypothetical protein ACP6IQ_04495 [Candidatus Njordarchaeia archaeon]